MVVLLFAQIMFCSAAQNLGDAVNNVGKAGEAAGYLPDVTPLTIISAVISTVVSLLGVIFVGLIIYGGFIWMTARGNEERVTKAKDLMTAAVIGLIIVLAAYAISYFVVSNITESTLKSSAP